MDEDLLAAIAADLGVSEICGDRIYWGEAPQGSDLPALVMHVIDGADSQHLRGTDGLWTYRVQIECYGINRTQAVSLSRALLAAINGFSNATLRGVFSESTRDDREDAAPGRPSRISHDFKVVWRG